MPLQAPLIDVDRRIELAALQQLVGEPAARIDVAGDLHLGARPAQIAVRVDDAVHARSARAAPARPPNRSGRISTTT